MSIENKKNSTRGSDSAAPPATHPISAPGDSLARLAAVPLLSALFQWLREGEHLHAALLDPQGKPVLTTADVPVCACFPGCPQNRGLTACLAERGEGDRYRCIHGLDNCLIPLRRDDIHVGSLLLGGFLGEPVEDSPYAEHPRRAFAECAQARELPIIPAHRLDRLLELCRGLGEVLLRERVDSLPRNLAEHLPGIVFECRASSDGDIRFSYVDGALEEMCEIGREQAMRAPSGFFLHIHPEDLGAMRLAMRESAQHGQSLRQEYRVLLPRHGTRWREAIAEPQAMADGSTVWHGFVADITERKFREEALRVEAAAFDSLEAIMVTDIQGRLLRVNRAFSEITGYSSADVLGKTPGQLKSGYHDQAFYQAMWESISRQGYWSGEIWNRRRDGDIYPARLTIRAYRDESGHVVNYVGTFSDISVHKESEQRIRELAFRDPLTKLANRHLLMDRLAKALAASKRTRQYGAVLFIDLDRFKALNDSHGHDMGDHMLRAVADRLRVRVRDNDSIARLGGDEFIVLLESLGGEANEARERALKVAEKLREGLAEEYVLGEGRLVYRNTASVGITLFLDHLEPIEALLKYADIALYQAKAAGRDQVRFHAPDGIIPGLEAPPRREKGTRNEQLIAQAIRRLELRMDAPMALAELAREIGTNTRKLSNLFREKFGVSAPKYFSELRLETGRRLLENTDTQIQLIAERVGFRNAGDFTRAFRRRYGLTPREYRRQSVGNGGADTAEDTAD